MNDRIVAIVLWAGLVAGCVPDGAESQYIAAPRDGGTAAAVRDGGASADAGFVDAGVPRDGGVDAGRDDGSVRDGGAVDGAPRDAGELERDAGELDRDAGEFDRDAGEISRDGGVVNSRDGGVTPPRDAGPPPPRDAGPPPRDAGPPPRDAGPPPYDAGPPPYDGGPTPDAGFPDSGVSPDAGVNDGGLPPPPTPPVYSGGACPLLVSGTNTNFLSASQSRSFLMQLPANPVGAGVVFVWHWLGGNPTDAASWTGYTNATYTDPVIVIAPYSCCSPGEWQTSAPPNNVDVQLFDDVLACLAVQYDIDMNRVWATGHSAGAIFTSQLIQHRANYLASIALLSGGQTGGFTVPQSPIPALLVWGGPTDTYGSFSFQTATLALSNNLQNNGHFVVHCSGTFGHQIPPEPPYTWPFLRDHPRGIQPEPYFPNLPPSLPNYCFIP